jgi:hypothetical protein
VGLLKVLNGKIVYEIFKKFVGLLKALKVLAGKYGVLHNIPRV